ncbi:zinc finger MYND domain-containing protein [Phanerochaete sordida]|uniref:Zinc finger MYND domain-containing protein n=1 Tax=Phanerochaete sordida TaxID=48140 RepID=A0A9P3G7T2_9APHY|nr:zinc finger MYND domain-containing protein [Phanerochaete sordida]
MPLSLRKQLTQCQHCWKHKTQGVTFKRCSACQIEVYCSAECQRAAWPAHKAKCALNARSRAAASSPGAVDKQEAFRAFTSKHRPTLALCGHRALDLDRNPRNAEAYFLCVPVLQRPGPQPAERRFVAQDAEVVPYDVLPPENVASMHRVREDAFASRSPGMEGVFFVVLHDVVDSAMHVVPVTYERGSGGKGPLGYKEKLLHNLNNGILV